jgi:hypothetical protein
VPARHRHREARRDKLQQRGQAFRSEAGKRIGAQRLRERRCQFDNERELQCQQCEQ